MHAFEFPIEPGPVGSCRVRVGSGALGLLAAELERDLPGRARVVIADDRVARHYAPALVAALGGASRCRLLTFPAGEEHKTRESKASLEDGLLAGGFGRDGVIVGLGGGVSGDLAGFVAATWHRGVTLIQAPTSLLAMVDACLGGKTAVDLPGAKNAVGAFHQPRAIYADIDTLTTLDDGEYRAGFAEAIKTAVIADEDLFHFLEARAESLLARDPETLETLVSRCLTLKSEVVAGDPSEGGRREMLNFGHTVGHALETASGYRMPHGHAVSIGMVAESALAVRHLGFPEGDHSRLNALLTAYTLPTRLPREVSVAELLAVARRDKKARRGRGRYALPARLGRMPAGPDPCTEIGERDVEATLRSLRT